MKTILFALIAFVCQASALADASRYVTLQVNTLATNELAVASNETAELVSYMPSSPVTPLSNIWVVRAGLAHRVHIQSWNRSSNPVIVAGPALLRHVGSIPGEAALCTFKITPGSFAPDKTIILPGDGLAAAVTFESSTNLVSWMAATNGVYSGSKSPRFFRIKLERGQ